MRIIGVFVVLFFVMIEDVQSKKIRNIWVISIFLLNLFLSLAEVGAEGLCLYPAKTLCWLIPLFLLYQSGGIGAGDAKLLAVLAASLGGEGSTWFWRGCLLCAAVIAFSKVVVGKTENRIPLALPMWFGYLAVLIDKGGVL